MTIQDIFAKYKPKEEYSIYAFQSKYTQRFVACIFKKGVIRSRFGNEPYEGSLKNINEEKIEKFLSGIKPYVVERNINPEDLAKFPLTPDEAFQKE